MDNGMLCPTPIFVQHVWLSLTLDSGPFWFNFN